MHTFYTNVITPEAYKPQNAIKEAQKKKKLYLSDRAGLVVSRMEHRCKAQRQYITDNSAFKKKESERKKASCSLCSHQQNMVF